MRFPCRLAKADEINNSGKKKRLFGIHGEDGEAGEAVCVGVFGVV
jgi:hypothetical protein